MQVSEENNLEQVRAEHARKIFELYQGKSKGFRNTFSVLFGFALIFLFVILMPYVSIKVKNAEISERLEVLSTEITQREQRITVYQKSQSGIEELQEQIANGPDRLRRFILAVEAEIDSPQAFSVQQSGLCDVLPPEERLNCRIEEELQSQFAGYQSILNQNVVSPLQPLDDEALAVIDLMALEEGLATLQATFEEKLAENPDFWRTLAEKEAFFAELDEEVDRAWREYGSVIKDQNKKLEAELADLQARKAQSEQQQAQLQTQEKQIGERLEQIEFPFGKIPVGLNESVALFPVLLAIGFLVSASLLVETMRLRKAFHTLYQQKDPSRTILTDRQIALITPLWIDPANPEQNQSLQFAILFIPAVIFIVTCGLIFYSWTIPDPFTGAGRLNQWVHGGLYVLSLGVFIYGSQLIFRESRRYSDGWPKQDDEM